jgi:hypothetical protein
MLNNLNLFFSLRNLQIKCKVLSGLHSADEVWYRLKLHTEWPAWLRDTVLRYGIFLISLVTQEHGVFLEMNGTPDTEETLEVVEEQEQHFREQQVNKI